MSALFGEGIPLGDTISDAQRKEMQDEPTGLTSALVHGGRTVTGKGGVFWDEAGVPYTKQEADKKYSDAVAANEAKNREEREKYLAEVEARKKAAANERVLGQQQTQKRGLGRPGTILTAGAGLLKTPDTDTKRLLGQ